MSYLLEHELSTKHKFLLLGHCCQLLSKLFGQINLKNRTLAKKFGIEANIIVFFQSQSKMVGKNRVYDRKIQFLRKYNCFNAKPNNKKDRPLFDPFLINRPKIRPQICSNPQNLFDPFCVWRPKYWPLGTTVLLFKPFK
jgi:hypothetical protein